MALDQHIDIRVAGHFEDVTGDLDPGGLALRVVATRANLLDHDRPAGATRDVVRVARQHIEGTATHGP